MGTNSKIGLIGAVLVIACQLLLSGDSQIFPNLIEVPTAETNTPAKPVTKAEILAMMNEVLPYLQPSGYPIQRDLLYRPPAAQLRQQADEIENRDAVIMRFMDLLKRLTKELESSKTNHPK